VARRRDAGRVPADRAGEEWPDWSTYERIERLFGWPRTFAWGVDKRSADRLASGLEKPLGPSGSGGFSLLAMIHKDQIGGRLVTALGEKGARELLGVLERPGRRPDGADRSVSSAGCDALPVPVSPTTWR
jgi:hypothetical protein